LHVLVPVQLDVQFDWQVALHVDCAWQVEVQLVPHVLVQLFCWSQLKVTPLGGPASPPSAAEPPSAPPPVPNEQVPPAAQVQAVPVQLHCPVQYVWLFEVVTSVTVASLTTITFASASPRSGVTAAVSPQPAPTRIPTHTSELATNTA
jgi:hypothetical protein